MSLQADSKIIREAALSHAMDHKLMDNRAAFLPGSPLIPFAGLPVPPA